MNRGLAAAVLATAVLAPSAAVAVTYTLTPIASTADGLTFAAPLVGVNADGTVVFRAASAAGEAIFTGTGGPLATVVAADATLQRFGVPVIDAAGAVAYGAVLTTGGEMLYRDGVPVAGAADGFSAFGGLPAAGQAGAVFFQATRENGPAGIFSGTGVAAPTILALADGTLQALGVPAAGGGGRVAFRALLAGGGAAIVTAAAGAAPQIVAQTGATFADFGDFPAIAADGGVAFRALLAAGGEAVVLVRGGAPVTVADTGRGAYAGFDHVAVNSAGVVAFQAALAGGGAGIFTGADPAASRVIQLGDRVATSTVRALTFGRDGLSDAGHVVFHAQLADGTEGVWRADPAAVSTSSTTATAGVAAATADVRVTALAVSPAVGGAGRTVTVTDTTKNRGTAPAAAGLTRFYFSADNVLDAGDVEIGARAVSALAPGAEDTGSTAVTIPSTATTGAYSIIASAGGTTKATGYKIGPDLRVANITGPFETAAGASITIGDSTENQGGGAAVASTTRFYLSTDAVLDERDVPLGARQVPALAAGATDTGTLTVMVPAAQAPGSYFLIARVDAADGVAEIAEGNNTRARALLLTAAAPRADLVVSALSVRPSLAGLTVVETTQNTGGASAPASATTYYLSRDGVLDAGDVPLFRRPVRALAAGALSGDSIGVSLPAGTSGTWYVIARADADDGVAESSKANNTRAAAVTIGPDLAMPSLFISAREVAAGDTVVVIDTVKNTGYATAPPSLTRFYLSSEDDVHLRGVLLGSRAVPELCARATDAAPTELVIPAGTAAGRYRIYAVADAGDDAPELRESNNVRGTVRFSVR